MERSFSYYRRTSSTKPPYLDSHAARRLNGTAGGCQPLRVLGHTGTGEAIDRFCRYLYAGAPDGCTPGLLYVW